jgi:transposase
VAQRRYRCVEPACPLAGFSEDHPLAPAQTKPTSRAGWWAISCIQHDNASVASVARRLGVDWHTVWDAIRPLLAELADDPARLAGVEVLGVDDHLWPHTPKAGKGPKKLTGTVDLTRHDGRPSRLLDLVPGRSRQALRRLALQPWREVHRRGEDGDARSFPGLLQRDPRRA